jgi:hypothetical protein
VFVSSSPNCPKIIVMRGKAALLKDDYYGRVRIGKSIAKRLL